MDKNNDEVDVTLEGHQDLRFVEYDEAERQLVFDQYTEEDIGKFEISIKLDDGRGGEYEDSITVEVIKVEIDVGEDE